MSRFVEKAPGYNDFLSILDVPRIYVPQLLDLRLYHLISGLDDDCTEHVRLVCGQSLAISGYTEWLAHHDPLITIGWDWRVTTQASPVTYLRYGLFRTNIVLINKDEKKLGEQATQDFVGQFIDDFDWHTLVAKFIQRRYA